MQRKGVFFLTALALAGWGAPAEAQEPPIDGPALGDDRITQDDITGGMLSVKDIRRKGLEIFSTPFNKHDGMGDGNDGPPFSGTFGERPTIQGIPNGTWLRVNGLDTQSCNGCHSVLSARTIPPTFTVGGVGGISDSAFPGVTDFDIADADANGVADINGRIINPPFVFGSGGVELVAKEMTVDLQVIKALAQANPGVDFDLITKGVDFGEISYDPFSGFDVEGVVGVDDDLVVRPFGRKGDNGSVRAFDLGALRFHQGMEPVETLDPDCPTFPDCDGDGVVDEVLIGELSALHIFSTSSDRPIRVATNNSKVMKGEELFVNEGCVTCHVPVLNTFSTLLPIAFPELETDPSANVFFRVDLVRGRAGFRRNGFGGVKVNMYSDLKRHDMGDDLAETTGGDLDRFFITPRLWGVADTAPYLHDGRALTIREAIEMHGGNGSEAEFAADNFAALPANKQELLLIFLNSLRVPKSPNQDLLFSMNTLLDLEF